MATGQIEIAARAAFEIRDYVAVIVGYSDVVELAVGAHQNVIHKQLGKRTDCAMRAVQRMREAALKIDAIILKSAAQ